MNYEQILSAIRILSVEEQSKLLIELTMTAPKEEFKSERQGKLFNKQVGCPHCHSMKFTRFGTDKGSFRFKCKECNRTFTEHTGTWLAGLHKKELVNDYLELMYQEKSLDKIKVALNINKKTAFDWRHKILSFFQDVEKEDINGIVESDETFFLQSEKGSKSLKRSGRKRGGKSSTRVSYKGFTKDNNLTLLGFTSRLKTTC